MPFIFLSIDTSFCFRSFLFYQVPTLAFAAALSFQFRPHLFELQQHTTHNTTTHIHKVCSLVCTLSTRSFGLMSDLCYNCGVCHLGTHPQPCTKPLVE